MIIDGKKLAVEHETVLKEKIQKLGIRPKVVSILVGDDPASLMYSNMKQKKATDLGIDFELRKYPSQTSWEEVVNKIKELSLDVSIHGIMIQLPLPGEFLDKHSVDELLQFIEPGKDIDGLTGKGPVSAATVRGVISILDDLKMDYKKAVFGVAGSEGQVGKEMAKELRKLEANVIEVDRKISAASLKDLKDVDVIVSCVGDKYFILPDHVRERSILIDVGLGDFDPRCYEKASAYTPERGGVGPMTVISLMENVVELFQKRN